MPDNLNRYLDAWDLSDPEPLAQTHSSHLYLVTYAGTRAVLKLLTERGGEEASGAIALRYWNGQGAVRLLRNDERAHLLEYAGGDDLVPIVTHGNDDQATAMIADVLNQLHSVTTTPLPDALTPLPVWFRSLFRKAELDQGTDSVYVRAAQVAEALFAEPRDVRVLHGDIHHENIRHCMGRGWLAFDPKGLIGECAFDCANVVRNPMNMPALIENESRLLRTSAILAERMSLDLSRVLAFIYAFACLSASWYVEDGVYPREDLRIAELVEPHVLKD